MRIWHTNQGSDQEPDTAVEASEAVMTVASGVCHTPFSVGVDLDLPSRLYSVLRTTVGFLEVGTLTCGSISMVKVNSKL